MDDALNTSSFRQPNTFMDVMVPSKSPRRGEPHRSSTLMRSAVKKPEPTISDLQNEPKVQIGFNASDHLEAASLTNQSPFISRISPSIYDQPSQPVESQPEATVPVYPSMEEGPSQEQIAPLEVQSEPEIEEGLSGLAEGVIPAPNFNVFNPQVPSIDSSFRDSASDVLGSIFRKLFSGWSVLGVAIIGLVACAFLINAHLSNLEFYLASSKVGFSATMPAIKPSGYDLSGISTGGGVIEASFKSNSDNRSYNISEKKSTISSSALLNGYVTNQAGLTYQTLKTEGKTIYIYDSHDATWVSNGIWYVIQDNNSLSDSQIMNIADSM